MIPFTKNVYLIGYMGVGKSSIGKRLAKQLRMPFFDLDLIIETSQGQSVSQIFSRKGEQTFRELEHECLLETGIENSVISTGGGTPCYGNNMDFMLENGIVVWLKMPAEIIVSRLIPKKATRPLIASIPNGDLLRFVQNHLYARIPYYKRAHIRFDASNINAKRMKQLVEIIQSYSK